jgi:hypothetical protein
MLRAWPREEARIPKTLAREKAKTVIARKLKRSGGDTYQKAMGLAVSLA